MSRRIKTKTDHEESVPRWFVTYSDVITLLMTFFILLLTFASSEPEGFAMMQESLFGSGGSAGTVGTTTKSMDQDTVVVRFKPKSSRLTSHGSEMPPMYTDPVTEAASRGLQTLDETNDLSKFEQFSLDVSLHLYVDSQGEPTEIAIRHLAMIAGQMKRVPLELTFTVTSPEHVLAVSKLAELLSTKFTVPHGRVAISLGNDPQMTSQVLRLKLRQEIE